METLAAGHARTAHCTARQFRGSQACSPLYNLPQHTLWQGLGEGVVMPSMNALMAKRVPVAWRSSALGVVYAGFHAGRLAACPDLACCVWRWDAHRPQRLQHSWQRRRCPARLASGCRTQG